MAGWDRGRGPSMPEDLSASVTSWFSTPLGVGLVGTVFCSVLWHLQRGDSKETQQVHPKGNQS